MSTTTISAVAGATVSATSTGSPATTAAAAAAMATMVLQKQNSASTPAMPINTPASVANAAGASGVNKHRHNSNASTHSSNSTSSSFDEPLEHTGSCPNQFIHYHHLQQQLHQQQPHHMNELLLDSNHQTVAIEMPANSMRIELDPFRPASEVHPEPGDIIEIDCTLFSQWAIYVGDGDVVQIAGADSHDGPDGEIAHVQRVSMAAMAGDKFCRVNNKLLRAKERNMLPFHNEITTRKALSKVSLSLPLSCSLLLNGLRCRKRVE